MTKLRVALIAAMLTALAGCSGLPTTPTTGKLTGTWSGTMTDNLSGTSDVLVKIEQTGTALSGTWATTFSGAGHNDGTLSGTVNASEQMDVVFTPTISTLPSGCKFRVLATVVGNQATGTYTSLSCSVLVTGIISLTL